MIALSARLDARDAEKGLAEILGRAANLDPAIEKQTAALVESSQERFQSETGTDGVRWRGLSQATIDRKRSEGGSTKVLTDSGDLHDSIIAQVAAGVGRVGTNEPYGAIHQVGGYAGRKRSARIDARPYLGVSTADKRELAEITIDHLEGGR